MRISAISTMALATVTAVAVTTAVVPSSAAPRPSSPIAAASSGAHDARATSKGTLDSRVDGTFGRNGAVHGSFVPTRSFVRHGQTYVQGTLSATLRRGNGTLVGRTVRHDVTLPLRGRGAHTSAAQSPAAAQASCNILHLVLGPLDLNLLGLKVHLNRVVLDITAQSGSGNLLGNLLCAVAHLLDNTSPNALNLLRLSNILNQIIGILT